MMHVVPTIPLYNPSAAPDGWHDVRVPGGFEAWLFDGAEKESDRKVFAGLFDGCPLHPRYQRLTARYLRNPTRHSPPLPRDFPCASLWIQRDMISNCEFVFRFPPGSLVGKSDSLDVRLGPNYVKRDANGQVKLYVEHDDVIRCEITVDANNTTAAVSLWRKGLPDLTFSCDGKFRHVVELTPGKLELDRYEPSGFRRRRIILCSSAWSLGQG
jgi:hypothetical protein